MSEFEYVKDADGIVTVTMNMAGPVNCMNASFRSEIAKCVDRLEQEEGLTGVVLASAKKTFFAGGDLKELYAFPKGEEAELLKIIDALKSPLRRLEKLPVPVVAAINGAALGGGFEICLSCNYRIISDKSSTIVGLPEVTLGLLPGAGGVVRMINLLGLEKALPLLLEGKKLKPAKAVELGLVNDMVATDEQLLPAAKAWIKANPEAGLQPWDQERHKIPGGDIHSPRIVQTLQAAPVMLYKKTRGLLPAPERILSVAADAVTEDFDTALKSESRGLAYLVTSPQAKNIINSLFFQLNRINGGASRPKAFEKTAVKKAGVVGSGVMGRGIALVLAKAGIEVVLKGRTADSVTNAKDYLNHALEKLVEKGRMAPDQKAALLARITATDKLADLQGCELIVESVPENAGLKKTVLSELEPLLAEGGVLATNTSSLPIGMLAECLENPSRFVGIHFFSPADQMPLVELVCGEKTSDETLARAFDFSRQAGKTPIVVNDGVGFFTTRVFLSLLDEGVRLLEDGVCPASADRMGLQLGMPQGPLSAFDAVSLSLVDSVACAHEELGVYGSSFDMSSAVKVARQMIAEHQRSGRAQGQGFYDYPAGGAPVLWSGLNQVFPACGEDNRISDQDIKDRLLFRQVIESLNSLQQGVLRSAADGNIGALFGIGAPAWTGGYLQFLNTYGLQAFVDRCDALAQAYGDRFRAPDIVRQKLAAGELFESEVA